MKKDDHAMDCMRYAVLYLAKFVKQRVAQAALVEQRRKELHESRITKLKYYKEHPNRASRERLSNTYNSLRVSPRQVQMMRSRGISPDGTRV
jgi:hypothetical protein